METKPWYQSWQLWAGLILFVLAVVDFKFIQMLGQELDVTIALSGLGLIGFRLKTNTGIEGVRILVFVMLPVFLFVGCAGTMSSVTEMHADRMENRVDKMYVLEAGRDDRGIMIRIPRPSNPTESLIEATLGWTRNYAGFAALPLDRDDTGRYIRGSNMGINTKDALNGRMDDILLIEVHSGVASEVEVEEEEAEDVLLEENEIE